MSPWSDMDVEGYRVPLDPDTADRLLAAAIAPEDAPPGYAGVARLLDAVAATPEQDDLEREADVVALIAEAVRRSPGPDPHSNSPRRSFMPFAFTRPRMTAAVLAAGLACSSGFATAGALPGAAQDVAAAMLAKVGVSVPGPNENAGTHPDGRGSSSTVTPSAEGKGSEISELATTTELTGVEKGAAISSAASGGKSKAGQHGQGSAGATAASKAAVATPSAGGTGTADIASGGKSSSGTATASEKSEGKSEAGGDRSRRP